MKASNQFLAAMGVMFAAGFIASGLRPSHDFGSTADWASAGANVAVVITSLYLATKESRERDRERREAVQEAREILRSSVTSMLTFSDEILGWLISNDWPTADFRHEANLQLQTIMIEWDLVKTSIVPKEDRTIGIMIAPRMHALRDHLADIISHRDLPVGEWAEGAIDTMRRLTGAVGEAFDRLEVL